MTGEISANTPGIYNFPVAYLLVMAIVCRGDDLALLYDYKMVAKLMVGM